MTPYWFAALILTAASPPHPSPKATELAKPAIPSEKPERSDQVPKTVATPGTGDVILETRPGMGTQIRIMLYTEQPTEARKAMDTAFREMNRVEALFSSWQPQSPISQLNAHAGGEALVVPSEVSTLLERGLAVSQVTAGAFSMSWAALADSWNFAEGIIPSQEALAKRVQLIDDKRLHVDKKSGTAKLETKGMQVGLGGIAKGYALDRAANVLAEAGFDNALIFAGGDIVARGSKGDTAWLIGLQDPRAAGHFATLELRDAAIATSGDYQRYFEKDGRRYHHILDPKTGHPARGLRSVSVVARSGELADAWATAVFVLGTEAGLKAIEAQPNLQAVFVTDDNEVKVTTGLKDRVQILRPPTP